MPRCNHGWKIKRNSDRPREQVQRGAMFFCGQGDRSNCGLAGTRGSFAPFQPHQQAFGASVERFYLYGHSAGGQFTARFLVTHPDRIERAVITSAATYPQPDPQVAWPFGLGELHTQITWDETTTRQVDVVPDQATWLAATQRPLTVIVGLMDTSELPAYPGQKGTDRYTIGSHWVDDMAAFAAANDLTSQIRFEAIPGIGHTMTGLLPYSQPALMEK